MVCFMDMLNEEVVIALVGVLSFLVGFVLGLSIRSD